MVLTAPNRVLIDSRAARSLGKLPNLRLNESIRQLRSFPKTLGPAESKCFVSGH